MKKTSYNFLQRPVETAIVLMGIAAIVLFFRLGSTPIYILDEAKNAQCAREMMQHNDWIVPTFNNELRAHKPPLHYYFMRASYKVFGITPFGARFPSALLGLLTIIFSWWFIKKFCTARIALLALLTMVLSTHFLFEFRMAVPDPYLIFFTTIGLFSFYAYIRERKTYWVIFSAVAMALAALSKGPVALALPGLAILAWLVLEKKIKMLLDWKLVMAAFVFLIVALPWYLLVHKATGGEFTRGFFLEHNIRRFNEPMEGHGGIFLLVPLFVFIGLLPMSVFLTGFIRRVKHFYPQPMVSFSIAISLVFILFFSFSGTKLPNYPMPCYPFLSLLIAYSMNNAIESPKGIKGPLIILFVFSLLLLAAAVIGFRLDPSLNPKAAWALLFLLPVVGIGVAIFRSGKNSVYALIAVVVCYCVFNLVGLGILYPAIYRDNPVSATIHHVRASGDIFAYQIYNPAFNFYIDQPIKVLTSKTELEKAIHNSAGAIIITRENYLPELEGLPLQIIQKYKDPLESPTTVILKYR
ncbi:MAG: glycosyltransferase family 39 protein [Ferruginibacter sp.]|nr:glycosyltransferase family 39 protein [Ferruginibacter sp.]